MIRAAIFNASDEPIKIMVAMARQLNLNIPPGGTWREIAETVLVVGDVPALASLSPHPDLVEPS